MKLLFVAGISALFMFLFLSCKAVGNSEKVMNELKAHYNKNEFKELYQMLSPDFKGQAPEAAIIGFYKTNLREPLGDMVSWKLTGTKVGGFNYAVQFQKGVLDLTLYLNSKDEIAGMQWLPSKETEIMEKKDVKTIRSNNPKQTKLQLLIDSLAIAHLQNAANCGLSIGIMNGDKKEMYFYGTTERGSDKLPDNNTLYEIGSVTKTFTGTLLANAINDGKIKADDDIRKYLPGDYANLQYKGKPIQIKHLSNHTSRLPGLPDDLGKQPGYTEQDPYRNYSKEMMFAYLKRVKLDTFPGTVNEYSNFAVALLGNILERVYNQPLESLVQKYITTPAKMNSTTFSVGEADKVKLAKGYAEEDGAETHYWELGAFNAAGGIKSCMSDMLGYLSANMKEINADIKLAHTETFRDAKTAIGLNWILMTTKDKQTLVWHNGATAGFSSFCGYIKEAQVGVVVLNNSGARVDNIGLGILKEINAESKMK